jgi:hypothetical protein
LLLLSLSGGGIAAAPLLLSFVIIDACVKQRTIFGEI